MGGTLYDAPNQEVVGVGPPWVEGSGGTPGTREGAADSSAATAAEEADLDAMTKDELLDYAHAHGVSPANASMTKDELRDSIEDAGA